MILEKAQKCGDWESARRRGREGKCGTRSGVREKEKETDRVHMLISRAMLWK